MPTLFKKINAFVLIVAMLSSLVTLTQASNATLGTSSNPASSCIEIKQKNPSATSGVYFIKYRGIHDTKEYYCDMENGSFLLFQRR